MDVAAANASWHVNVNKHFVKTGITVQVRVNAAGTSSLVVAGAVLLVHRSIAILNMRSKLSDFGIMIPLVVFADQQKLRNLPSLDYPIGYTALGDSAFGICFVGKQQAAVLYKW